jgi:hypothetical protein
MEIYPIGMKRVSKLGDQKLDEIPRLMILTSRLRALLLLVSGSYSTYPELSVEVLSVFLSQL